MFRIFVEQNKTTMTWYEYDDMQNPAFDDEVDEDIEDAKEEFKFERKRDERLGKDS